MIGGLLSQDARLLQSRSETILRTRKINRGYCLTVMSADGSCDANLALVRSIAQTAVVLSEGRVVESGAVDQILEHPTHPYTIRLIGDVPHLGADGDGFSTDVSSH